MQESLVGEEVSGGTPEEYVVREESPREHFWMTPNVVDRLELSPQAFRLYSHYKCIAGERRGRISEGVRETAKACKLDKSKIGSYREELEDAGLIDIVPSTSREIPPEIVILDIWTENAMYFGREVSAKTDRGVRENGQGVYAKTDTPIYKEEGKKKVKRKDSVRKTSRAFTAAEISDIDERVMDWLHHDQFGDLVAQMIRGAADLNKTKRMAASRMWNAFIMPIVEARKHMRDAALRYGLEEALSREKFDVRYALAVARRNPDGAPTSPLGSMNGGRGGEKIPGRRRPRVERFDNEDQFDDPYGERGP